jgi:hypothetical protein
MKTPAYTESHSFGTSVQPYVQYLIEELIASLPDRRLLSSGQRRGIIARYTAVLEGNFIYWMTAAYLSVKSEKARLIILDNLLEEVRDSHPRMLRNFALAADGLPTDSDSMAIHDDLTNVRMFMGQLSGVRIIITMAFFEGFIQRFMAYLAELAAAQGSTEFEYTDVHGVCDITHTEELFHALAAEIALNPAEPSTELFEGVDLLRNLILRIVDPALLNQKVHPVPTASHACAGRD